MPAQRRRQQQLNPILQLARPKQRTRFHVRIIEGIAVLEGKNGAVAVVPREEVCRLAERLNLELEGLRC